MNSRSFSVFIALCILFLGALAWYLYPGFTVKRCDSHRRVYSTNKLVASANIIVRGEFGQHISNAVYQGMQDPTHIRVLLRIPLVPTSVNYEVCEFHVTEYLKGTGPKTLRVHLPLSSSLDPVHPRHMPVAPGQELVLFLQRDNDYPWLEPYRFRLEQEQLQVVSNYARVRQAFNNPIPLEELRQILAKNP